MARVIQFEIAADIPARAIAFYENVFGWVFEKWDGPIDYWLITTGEPGGVGIDGGLVPRRGPLIGPENTIGVPSIDLALQKVMANGGRILQQMGSELERRRP